MAVAIASAPVRIKMLKELSMLIFWKSTTIDWQCLVMQGARETEIVGPREVLLWGIGNNSAKDRKRDLCPQRATSRIRNVPAVPFVLVLVLFTWQSLSSEMASDILGLEEHILQYRMKTAEEWLFSRRESERNLLQDLGGRRYHERGRQNQR